MGVTFYRYCALRLTITKVRIKLTWLLMSNAVMDTVLGEVINSPVSYGETRSVTIKNNQDQFTCNTTLDVQEVIWVVGRKRLIPLGFKSNLKTGIVIDGGTYLTVPPGKSPAMVVQSHHDAIKRITELAGDLDTWITRFNNRK